MLHLSCQYFEEAWQWDRQSRGQDQQSIRNTGEEDGGKTRWEDQRTGEEDEERTERADRRTGGDYRRVGWEDLQLEAKLGEIIHSQRRTAIDQARISGIL